MKKACGSSVRTAAAAAIVTFAAGRLWADDTPASALPPPAAGGAAVAQAGPAVSTGAAPRAASAVSPRAAAAQPTLEEGFFHARLGNHERAVQLFLGALEMDPENRRAMLGLGTSYIALERYAEATNVLMRAVMLDRQDYIPLNNLAWLFATARDIRFRDGQQAIRLAHEALMIAPADFHVWSTLAEAYYVSGEYQRARRTAEEALRLARAANLPPSRVQEYEQQVRRCQAAAEAMSILE